MKAEEILNGLWQKAKSGLSYPAEMLVLSTGYLALLCVMRGLITAPAYADALDTVGLMGFSLLCGSTVLRLLETIQQGAENWYTYLAGFVPVFSGVMATGGQVTSAAVYSGLFLGASGLLTRGIAAVLVPAVRIYLAVVIAAQLWGNKGLLEAAQLLYRGVNWLLKGVCVLAMAILGLQGTISGSMDKTLQRGGKALSMLVLPVVGEVVDKAMGTVSAGLSLLKSSLAFAAITTITIQFLPDFFACLLAMGCLWLLSICAGACGLSDCGALARNFAQGIQICFSAMVLYFLLVLCTTLMMVFIGGGAA